MAIPSWLDLDVEYRLRYETQDVRYRILEEGGDQQLAHRSRLRLGIRRALDPFRFVAEFEDARVNLTDSGSMVNSTHVRELSVLQLHGRLVSESFLGRSLRTELQFGRITLDLGKRRLVARNLFRNVTNRFDGVRWWLNAPARWDFQFFAFQPVVYGLRDLNRGERKGYFGGAYFQDQRHGWMWRDIYYLHLHEDEQSVGPRRRRLKTLGARFYRTPAGEGWVYEVETSWQFGRTGGLEHFAHLQNVEGGHRWGVAWKPLLLFQYTYSSGDRDPFDDRTQRFDSLYGARRFELAPTGIYALFSRSNLNGPGFRVMLRPHRKLEGGVHYRHYMLAQARDEWRGTGRYDVTGRSGADVGHQLETAWRWRMHPNLSLEAGHARLWPGLFVRLQVPSSQGRGSNYFYVQTELRM